MKVGFLAGNLSGSGGTERVLSKIANGLVKRGYSVFVISMWGETKTTFLVDRRIRRYRLGYDYPRGVGRNVKNIFSVYQIVKKENPAVLVDVDLILVFYSLPAGLLLPSVRQIAWEHFNFYYHFRKNNRIRRLAMRLAAAFSDVILVLSKEDRKYYAANLNIRGRLCQIYNPNTYESSQIEKTVCEAKEEKMVFAAGRLTRAKGFDLLLRSWKLVEDEFPEWRLCIAGSGEEEQSLRSCMRENDLKSVDFIGQVSGMRSFYEKAAFFVLPSRYEGFGMVLTEAMSFGKPVVSYACKAGPREIISNGKDGFLVEPEDYVAFASKMRCLMESNELRRTMGRHAAQSIRRFDLEGILDQWELLLTTTVKMNAK